MASVYTWTCDPRGRPPNPDTPRCSRRRSLSVREQRRLFTPVKADGRWAHAMDGALTSILRLRSLKMEEMIVSSSVCRTSSLDGQMSRRYTSFPSEVTPVPHNSVHDNHELKLHERDLTAFNVNPECSLKPTEALPHPEAPPQSRWLRSPQERRPPPGEARPGSWHARSCTGGPRSACCQI